jgi:hypothetical protein
MPQLIRNLARVGAKFFDTASINKAVRTRRLKDKKDEVDGLLQVMFEPRKPRKLIY